MTARALARIEPTDAQLRATWTRIRRASWPATFEGAMADAICARLLRMNALHTPATSSAATPGPVRSRATEWHQVTPVVQGPGYVDHKRAAAGDRDD